MNGPETVAFAAQSLKQICRPLILESMLSVIQNGCSRTARSRIRFKRLGLVENELSIQRYRNIFYEAGKAACIAGFQVDRKPISALWEFIDIRLNVFRIRIKRLTKVDDVPENKTCVIQL